jgi:hypothetical protein
MLVIKSKNRKNRQKYIVGGGLALIPPDNNSNNTSTCCNNEISTIPVSNGTVRKALTEKSKEFLHELKKKQS